MAIDKEALKSKIAPVAVTDLAGNVVEDEEVIPIPFESGNRKYVIHIAPSAYTTKEVFGYQDRLKALQTNRETEKATAAAENREPASAQQEEFGATDAFLSVGAVSWNVPGQNLSEGLLNVNYQTAMAAVEAILGWLNPTSDGQTPSSSTTSPSSSPAEEVAESSPVSS